MRSNIFKLTMVVFLVALAGSALAGNTALNATSEEGILVFESNDSAFKWWVDARVYLDAAMYMDDGPLYDADNDLFDDEHDDYDEDLDDMRKMHDALAGGFILRRARFAIKSQLWDHWYGEVDLDFAEEAAAVKDAYISYRGLFGGNGRVRVGNFRQPNGLEESTTSRNLMFMERSQGTEPFVVGRRMGLEVAGWKPQYRWAVSMFGADVDEFAKPANEQVNFATRLNYAPITTDESTLMVGFSGTLQKPAFVGAPNEDDEREVTKVKFNTRPESNVSDTKLVYAKIKDIEKYSNFGGELAYVNKRLMFQGEYMMTNIDRYEDKESISFNGGYAFVSYFLTDDMHKYDYKDAEFGRLIPKAKSGAWEVALRYSMVDMNDLEELADDGDDEQYGGSTSITLGVNYYPNPNVKLMLNYGHVDNDEFATGDDDEFMGDYDFDYVQMRFQTAF